jgi:hypothetical protein
MENKVRYLFYQEVRRFYENVFKSPEKLPLSFIDGILHTPLENKY